MIQGSFSCSLVTDSHERFLGVALCPGYLKAVGLRGIAVSAWPRKQCWHFFVSARYLAQMCWSYTWCKDLCRS